MKYAKRPHKSYKMRFFPKRGKPAKEIFHAHTHEKEYLKVRKLLSPESLAEGFYGFSFSRDYPLYDDPNEKNFSNIEWVENEIINEFSDLMYLYLMFSKDDPLKDIEVYKNKKIDFDNKRMSGRQHLK
jgi:hypothetical protein